MLNLWDSYVYCCRIVYYVIVYYVIFLLQINLQHKFESESFVACYEYSL